MGKKGQLVVGPAGSGKSTYCKTIYEHCANTGRVVHVINLDPAADAFDYPVSVDIRSLITLTDVMEVYALGPNGGLVYCLEYLLENIGWLEEQIGEYDDDYVIFDCPGQIELYMHVPVMPELLARLQGWGYTIAGVYVVDSQFVCDGTKFLSGALMCLAAMLQLELPHVNVLTKMDMLKARGEADDLDGFLDADTFELLSRVSQAADPRYRALNGAIAELLNTYSLVSFLPLDITDEDSVANVLASVDHAIQWGEDEEVKEPKSSAFDDGDGDGDDDGGRGGADDGMWGMTSARLGSYGEGRSDGGGAADDMERND